MILQSNFLISYLDAAKRNVRHWERDIFTTWCGSCIGYAPVAQPHQVASLSLIRNRTIARVSRSTKNTFFYFTTTFCNRLHFIFQYFDSVCFIRYLITCYKLVLIWNFNFLAKVCPGNYLITWNLSATLYSFKVNLFRVNLFADYFEFNLFSI